MKLQNVLRAECVTVSPDIPDKQAAIAHIAKTACQSQVLKSVSEDEIRKALADREGLGTTAFGDGIAIPHCRLDSVDEFVVGIVVVPDGVEFDALDKKPVKLFVFIIAPSRETDEHIKLLSKISQALSIPGAVSEVCSCSNPESVRESFLRHSLDEVDPEGHGGTNLFHVFIQNEDLFHQILQIFNSLESVSEVVVEAQSASNFLKKMPLFAGFWSDEAISFCTIIMAAVDKRFTNEILRKIERVTGRLDECDDVLVLVQDVFYSAGRLHS